MQANILDDVKVLDFSQAIAGPYAGCLLAEYGADVVSIEPPGGGSQRRMLRGVVAPNVDHNKQSIELNLKGDVDSIIRRLTESADVLIHNYTPGTMERLGCDYETLREYKEDLIFCSLTGYGEDGPYRDRPGFDPLAQAMSGMMAMTGEPDRKPSRIGASVLDHGAGSHLAFAAITALLYRERTGKGQKIEVSLFDIAGVYMGYWYTYYSRVGRTPQRMGHTWELNAAIGLFNTADDPVYLAAESSAHWERFCKVMGREEWINDERFATPEGRREYRETLHEEIEELFAEYSAATLVEKLLDARVPVAEYQTVAQAANSEHLEHRGTLREIPDEQDKSVKIGAFPIKFSEATPDLEGLPEVGEHTEEVLINLGFTSSEIDSFRGDAIPQDDT